MAIANILEWAYKNENHRVVEPRVSQHLDPLIPQIVERMGQFSPGALSLQSLARFLYVFEKKGAHPRDRVERVKNEFIRLLQLDSLKQLKHHKSNTENEG
jgi:hypothetical protein